MGPYGSQPSGVGAFGSGPSGVGAFGSGPSQVTSAGTSTAFKVAVSLGAVALLVAVGVIGYLLARQPGAPAPAPVVAAPARPAGPDANGNATAYLDEAERLAKGHRFKSALALLAQARQAKATDAQVNIRLAHLEDRVETDAALASAERYLSAGDTQAAIAAAKDALDRDPDDARALALLKKASAARAGAAGTPALHARKPGRLTVTSSPEGAMVYVDDVPVGHTPLHGHGVDPGRHALEIRLRGYRTETRHLRVRAGRRTSLRVHLAEGVKHHLAASEVAEASQPAAPSPAAPADPASPSKTPSKGAGAALAGASPASGSTAKTVAAHASPPAPKAAPPKAAPPKAAPPPPAAPAVKVAAATPAPSPAPAGPTPAHPLAPRLPSLFHARSMQDLARAVGAVESEAVKRAGVPGPVARKVGGPLLHALVRSYSPGTTTVLYPKAMYYLVVHELARGTDVATIGEDLKRHHFSGAFQAHPDPAR